MIRTKTDGISLSLIASFCGATVPIFSKLVLEYFTPQVSLFLRMVFSFVLISILLAVFIKPKIEIDKHTLRIALFGALNFVFLMFGIKYIPAVLAPIFYSLVPIEVTVFSFILFREKISVTKLVGIVVGYFGALVVLYPTFSGANTSDVEPLGVVLVLLGSCSVALFSLLIQRSNSQYSPYNLSFQAITLAFIFSIPMLLIQSSKVETLKGFDWKVIWLVVGIAVIGTIGQYIIFQNAIAKIKASANVIFFYFQPIFVITLSLIFLDENIGIYYFIGLVFVLIGSSLNIGVHAKLRELLADRKTIRSLE